MSSSALIPFSPLSFWGLEYIFEATVHDLSLTKVEDSVKNTCALHLLPAELRDEIFNLLFSEPWSGKVLGIIKALRPDQKFYKEALTFFSKLQAFELHRGNKWSFSGSRTALPSQ
jgi:hypothetical protein